MIRALGWKTALQMGMRGSRHLWSKSAFQQKYNMTGNTQCDKAKLYIPLPFLLYYEYYI